MQMRSHLLSLTMAYCLEARRSTLLYKAKSIALNILSVVDIIEHMYFLINLYAVKKERVRCEFPCAILMWNVHYYS